LDKRFKSYGNLSRATHFLKITVTLTQTIITTGRSQVGIS